MKEIESLQNWIATWLCTERSLLKFFFCRESSGVKGKDIMLNNGESRSGCVCGIVLGGEVETLSFFPNRFMGIVNLTMLRDFVTVKGGTYNVSQAGFESEKMWLAISTLILAGHSRY